MRASFALFASLLATAVFAQADDEPIPYPEEEPVSSNEPTLRASAAFPDETRGYEEGIGLGAQLLGGGLLLSSSRAQLAEPTLGYGARIEWDAGRIFDDDTVREALFLDATWTTGLLRDGTRNYFADTRLHYFTLAPAWALRLGAQSDYAFYAQLGGGIAYQLMATSLAGTAQSYDGLLPLLQYGIGFRGRPRLGASGLRFSFRLEVTRFRRSYMDDTLLALSVGAAF